MVVVELDVVLEAVVVVVVVFATRHTVQCVVYVCRYCLTMYVYLCVAYSRQLGGTATGLQACSNLFYKFEQFK